MPYIFVFNNCYPYTCTFNRLLLWSSYLRHIGALFGIKYHKCHFLNQRKKTIINQFNEGFKEGFTYRYTKGRLCQSVKRQNIILHYSQVWVNVLCGFLSRFSQSEETKKNVSTHPGMNECPMRPYWYSSLRRATLAINESLLTMLVSISYPREKIDTKCQTDYISF